MVLPRAQGRRQEHRRLRRLLERHQGRMNPVMKDSAMKACVMMAGCAILLLLTFAAISESQSPTVPPGVVPPGVTPLPRKPESDSEKQSRQRQETLLGIWKLLASGQDRAATGEWEQFFAVNPHSNTLETLA